MAGVDNSRIGTPSVVLVRTGKDSGDKNSNHAEREQDDDNNGECAFHFSSITEMF